jgi:hypothetical protein
MSIDLGQIVESKSKPLLHDHDITSNVLETNKRLWMTGKSWFVYQLKTLNISNFIIMVVVIIQIHSLKQLSSDLSGNLAAVDVAEQKLYGILLNVTSISRTVTNITGSIVDLKGMVRDDEELVKGLSSSILNLQTKSSALNATLHSFRTSLREMSSLASSNYFVATATPNLSTTLKPLTYDNVDSAGIIESNGVIVIKEAGQYLVSVTGYTYYIGEYMTMPLDRIEIADGAGAAKYTSFGSLVTVSRFEFNQTLLVSVSCPSAATTGHSVVSISYLGY